MLSQYKLTLSDEATPLKDEWGPWIEMEVDVPDTETGELTRRRVLKSDPAGGRS